MDIDVYLTNDSNSISATWTFYVTGTRILSFESDVVFPNGTTGWTPGTKELSIAGSTGQYYLINIHIATVNSTSIVFCDLKSNLS